MVVVTLLGGAAIAGTTGRPAQDLTLDDPALSTSSVFDVTDDAAPPTPGTDQADAPNRASSVTVGDLTDSAAPTAPPLKEIEATVIADPLSKCVWLVNIAGQNPASLFLVAWPPETSLSWGPFSVSIDTDSFQDGSTLTGTGLIYTDIAAATIALDDERLFATGACEAEGLVDLRKSP